MSPSQEFPRATNRQTQKEQMQSNLLMRMRKKWATRWAHYNTTAGLNRRATKCDPNRNRIAINGAKITTQSRKRILLSPREKWPTLNPRQVVRNLLFLKFFSHLFCFRKRKLLWQKMLSGWKSVRICWAFWIGRMIPFHSAILSTCWMYPTTCKSLTSQWTCKLLVRNCKPIITQRFPSSPKTSVSSLQIPRSLDPAKHRWFTRWLIDSRSYLKITSATFWLPMKLGRQQLDVIRNCSNL